MSQDWRQDEDRRVRAISFLATCRAASKIACWCVVEFTTEVFKGMVHTLKSASDTKVVIKFVRFFKSRSDATNFR